MLRGVDGNDELVGVLEGAFDGFVLGTSDGRSDCTAVGVKVGTSVGLHSKSQVIPKTRNEHS